MRNQILAAVFLMLLGTVSAFASQGVIHVSSDFSVAESADRFENILNSKNMTVFGRIKHSEGARKVGVELRATELILFGNPKVGSPLMQCRQGVAIDLPQKALFWEDAEGKVWISYNDPGYLKERHNITGCEGILKKLVTALGGMVKAAAIKADGG